MPRGVEFAEIRPSPEPGCLRSSVPLWLNPLGDLGVLCGEQLEHPLPADRFSGDLVVEPLRIVGFGQRDDPHAHLGVRQAAELGALAVEVTRLAGFDREGLHAARHGVLLPVQARDPEGVDDVA